MEKTHIIILNWNGGPDTWKCVRSVCTLPEVRITVLDNASSDDSLDYLRSRLTEEGIAATTLQEEDVAGLPGTGTSINIVCSRTNKGFASGINFILRPFLNIEGAEFVWLLNNDAIASPDSLSALITAMETDPRVAFAGSVIMDGRRTGEVQCFGVRYYKWLGVGKMLFKGRDLSSISREEISGAEAHFQHGASLLVRMEAIRQVGLLDERFFLYSEEHDWQERARKEGLRNIRVPESRVFHLGSMSTERSKHLFYYYYSGSSVIFSRKHHKGIVAITATCMLVMITLIRTRLHPKSMRWALKGILEAWREKL